MRVQFDVLAVDGGHDSGMGSDCVKVTREGGQHNVGLGPRRDTLDCGVPSLAATASWVSAKDARLAAYRRSSRSICVRIAGWLTATVLSGGLHRPSSACRMRANTSRHVRSSAK